MGASAGEFGAVASQGHDDGTSCAADVRGYPNGDEPALLRILDPAATNENVTYVPPEAHFDATDPWGRGDGAWTVKAAGVAEGAGAVADVEHIDIERIVSGAAAAPHIPPLLAVPLQERNVLTHSR
ncbi:hypothetical protein ACWC2K_19425 [Streptomyces chattanoogensis]